MMFILLYLTVFCYTAGALESQETFADEIRRILVNIDEDQQLYEDSLNPDEMLSKRYLGVSPTEHPEGHWPSTVSEYKPVDHSEGQQDEWQNDGHFEHPSEDYKPGHPIQVGSLRGIPGINFPDYKDIPITHFSCSDKVYVPGFYADMETGCQVFHVCWPHRRESFLCPLGTIFNQAILTCDYWYSSNCSLTSNYYDVNEFSFSSHTDQDYKAGLNLGPVVDTLLGEGHGESTFNSGEASSSVSKESIDLSQISKFLPVKAKVVVYPESAGSRSKIIAEASVGKTEKSHGFKHVSQKPRMHEKLQPEDMSAHSIPSTYHRRPRQKVIEHGARHTDVENKQYMDRIVDEILKIVNKLTRESAGEIPAEDGFPKSKWQHESRRNLPLTKLNPRFITKPVEGSKRHIIKPSIQHSTKFRKV